VAAGATDIEIVRDRISIEHLTAIAVRGFGDLVKAVVDVQLAIMAVGGELHADGEAVLLDAGSAQADLWGINLYPDEHGTSGWLEFDSMINVRPRQENRSRSVEDPAVRDQIVSIVERLVR
jgi:hypothetical protein